MIRFEKARGDRIKIIPSSDALLDNLIEQYSIPNPASRFSTFSPACLSAITPLGTFQRGLIHNVIKMIKKLTSEKIDISKIIDWVKDIPIKKNSDFIKPIPFDYRDYQLNTIEKCLSIGRGLVELPTGSGKSAIIYGICKNSNSKKIFILTPNIQLVKQIHEDLLVYGFDKKDIQMYSSFSKELENKRITISNRQWVTIHPLDFYADLLIVDEIHTVKKGSKVERFVKSFKTENKFGFTGTLPDCQYQQWNLQGIFGQILISKDIKEMQTGGFISNIKIYPIEIHHENKRKFPRNTYEDICNMHRYEYQHIEECDRVNEIILRIPEKLKGNSIIFFDHILHGQRLYDMSKNILQKKNVFYVDGSIPLSDRLDMCKAMETTNNVVGICNCKCIGTGINIQNMQNIIFATFGYATTKIIQGIGRSLRLHPEKKNAILVDIHHNYTYSLRHFTKRMTLYQKNYSKESLQKTKTIFIH
jgi:ATP-dependent helicase IRC3